MARNLWAGITPNREDDATDGGEDLEVFHGVGGASMVQLPAILAPQAFEKRNKALDFMLIF